MKRTTFVLSATLIAATFAWLPSAASAQTVHKGLDRPYMHINQGLERRRRSTWPMRAFETGAQGSHTPKRPAKHGNLKPRQRARPNHSMNRKSKAIHGAKNKKPTPG